MIGIRAIVFEGSIVGVNTTVLENSNIPKRSIFVGVPAKVVKNVDNTTYSRIKKHALRYYELANSHKGTIF